jgi:hypothetical protein
MSNNKSAIDNENENENEKENETEKDKETKSLSETQKETFEVDFQEYKEFCNFREKMKRKLNHEKKYKEFGFCGIDHKFGYKFGHKCKYFNSDSDSLNNEKECRKSHMGDFCKKFHHMKNHQRCFTQLPQLTQPFGFGFGFPFQFGFPFGCAPQSTY